MVFVMVFAMVFVMFQGLSLLADGPTGDRYFRRQPVAINKRMYSTSCKYGKVLIWISLLDFAEPQ